MITILVWVATFLPITYFDLYKASFYTLLLLMLLLLGAVTLIVMPSIYIALLVRHRCPKCRSLWQYALKSERVIDSSYQPDFKGGKVRLDKVLQESRCAVCNYSRITDKIRTIKEL